MKQTRTKVCTDSELSENLVFWKAEENREWNVETYEGETGSGETGSIKSERMI